MEAVYGWVKNIIYYMIFLSVVNNLLADSKYGKYIRFFSGMVLILLVVSPFTGGLHLDEQISSMFKSISFQNDTDDLKQDLWGMEERRLDQVIREYEQAVAADVEAMARAEGLECTGASVQIDGDRNSSRYGQIEGIGLVISGEKADTEQGSWDYMGSRPVNVDAGRQRMPVPRRKRSCFRGLLRMWSWESCRRPEEWRITGTHRNRGRGRQEAWRRTKK